MIRKTRKATKATKGRPSPTESATAFPEGTIRVGGNKGRWVVTKTVAGVKRWTLYENAALNGYAPLSVDVLCKTIGKPIKVYERVLRFYEDTWPTGPRDFDVRYEITPTGDLTFGGKLRPQWIETQKPRLPSGANEVMGTYSSFGNYKGPIHVDPIGKCLVSSNVDTTEAFVKI
jgi:hypothetical protein